MNFPMNIYELEKMAECGDTHAILQRGVGFYSRITLTLMSSKRAFGRTITSCYPNEVEREIEMRLVAHKCKNFKRALEALKRRVADDEREFSHGCCHEKPIPQHCQCCADKQLIAELETVKD